MSGSRERHYHSIRLKVLFSFILVSTLLMLVYFVFYRNYTYQSSISRYDRTAEQNGQALTSNLSYYISSCVASVRSIYYNNELFDELTDKSSNFINSETTDSKKIYSYLLSIYSAVPYASQIHLSAYPLRTSFLLTTGNLQRYQAVLPYDSYESAYPEHPVEFPGQSIWVEGTHPLTDYNHMVSKTESRNQNVFTVHVPLFKLPSSRTVIGLLSVDISTDYIDSNCSFNEDEDNHVYILDENKRVVYARNQDLISTLLPDSAPEAAVLTSLPKKDGSSFLIEDNTLIKSWPIESPYCTWTLYSLATIRSITHEMLLSQSILLTVFVFFLLLFALILYVILLRYLHPLSQIATFIRINTGDEGYNLNNSLSAYISYPANDEVRLLIDSIDHMLSTIHDSMLSQYQLALANQSLELMALQAQINPHFIYNTLQFIASTSIEHGDMETYSYIASFGQMLQYAMDFKHTHVSLTEEADYLSRYLQLQSMRFGTDIRFEIDLEGNYGQLQVPKMLLQPLVENTIKHGRLTELADPCLVLAAHTNEQDLLISLTDNGVPIDPAHAVAVMEQLSGIRAEYEALESLSSPTSSHPQKRFSWSGSERIGIPNVYMRCLLHFGDGCRMSIGHSSVGGTNVQIRIPLAHISFVEDDKP